MRRRLSALFIAGFLAPHFAVAALGIERFPFTCAAMFASYIGPQTPRHAFEWIARFEAGGPGYPIQLGDTLASGRHFFGNFYGSIDPATHHRRFPDDTPEAFEARLSRWLRGFHATWSRHNRRELPAPLEIELRLRRVHPDGFAATRTRIGRYDATTQRFELDPERRAAYAAAQGTR